MRIIGNDSLSGFLQVSLALASILCMPAPAFAEDSQQARNDAYLDQVVGVMRSHVHAMRMILDHDDL